MKIEVNKIMNPAFLFGSGKIIFKENGFTQKILNYHPLLGITQINYYFSNYLLTVKTVIM